MNEKLLDFLERRPDIRDKFIFEGTFRDYAIDIGKAVTKRNEDSRLLKKIKEEGERLLGRVCSLRSIGLQLSQYPLVSYADHHGFLNYKLLYNSNLLYYLIMRELNLPYVIVLATGNIPLKNISFPRGFYFKNQKFNFFSVKHSKTPVYLMHDKISVNREKGIKSFIGYQEGNIDEEEKKFLDFLFFECLQIEDAERNYEVFSDQVTFLNNKLWKYYFDKSLRDTIPEMIYLQTNKVILSILLEEILKEDSLISSIIFDPDIRKIYLKNFQNIGCCWGEEKGSHLFWGIVEKRNAIRFISLSIDDTSGSLVGEDFKLALERESIVDALLKKEVIPTQFFDFLIVTFLEEFLALGGFNQLEYLPQMQAAHIKSLREIGRIDLAEKFAEPISHGLICGMYPFEFDSGIDLIWHYNSHDGKFNGNMDGGLTREDLDNVSNMLVTELVSKGIDRTLEIL